MDSNHDRTEVFSQKIKAGKRTYFFDVKATRAQDYYITITESKRKFSGEGYEKHKIFLYKEDFNKFLGTLSDTINHVKTELLPDYNYEEFDRDSISLDGNNHIQAAADDGDGEDKKVSTEVKEEPGLSWDD